MLFRSPVTLTNWAYADSLGAISVTYNGTITGFNLVTGSKYKTGSQSSISTVGLGVNYYPGTTAGSNSYNGIYIG